MICYVLNGKSPEPAQVGFALFVFPLGQAEGGYIDYLSNADRTDMMLALREFLAKQEEQGNEFRLTDLDGGGCRWRFWMHSEDRDRQRLCNPAPECHHSVQEMLLGARRGPS